MLGGPLHRALAWVRADRGGSPGQGRNPGSRRRGLCSVPVRLNLTAPRPHRPGPMHTTQAITALRTARTELAAVGVLGLAVLMLSVAVLFTGYRMAVPTDGERAGTSPRAGLLRGWRSPPRVRSARCRRGRGDRGQRCPAGRVALRGGRGRATRAPSRRHGDLHRPARRGAGDPGRSPGGVSARGRAAGQLGHPALAGPHGARGRIPLPAAAERGGDPCPARAQRGDPGEHRPLDALRRAGRPGGRVHRAGPLPGRRVPALRGLLGWAAPLRACLPAAVCRRRRPAAPGARRLRRSLRLAGGLDRRDVSCGAEHGRLDRLLEREPAGPDAGRAARRHWVDVRAMAPIRG